MKAIDRDGVALQIGDRVYIPCQVVRIDWADDSLNVILQTVHPVYPGEHPATILLNSKQVVLAPQGRRPS